MATADFLIIGGGIAGLALAARLTTHGRLTVLEGEEALGYHSSGRSVTFSHFGIGNSAVRALTAYSRAFFETPPERFRETPLCRPQASLYASRAGRMADLEQLQAEIARFTDAVQWVTAEEMARLCPILRTGGDGFVKGVIDPSGLRLDADALLQAYARTLKAGGGQLLMGRRIAAIENHGCGWRVRGESGEEWNAPILINAAGAWADHVAGLAGVAPLGLRPLRRTIIVVDPPEQAGVHDWPFVHSAAGDFYMLPEAGRLLVSPVDEIPTDPCDAHPEEIDIAVAAAKLEEYTTLQVRTIAHSWAGLRSFVADRVPTAGFAADAPGFFWLAGQGGYGLQTAPAMAEASEALITVGEWPAGLASLGVTAEKIDPARLVGNRIS